jgi:hypothetical protein
MLVHSFLPIVGLSLVSLATAQDNSSQVVHFGGGINAVSDSGPSKRWTPPQGIALRHSYAPVKRAQSGICDALPNKWSYMGW